VRSLAAITEPAVRAYLETALARPETLGLILIGSRALGWAEATGDFDVLIVVTPERAQTLTPEKAQVILYADGDFPKQKTGDFSYISERVLEAHLRSPLDIDHWPYQDAAVLGDRTGRLADWRARLAALPDGERRERAVQKYLQLAIALNHATADDVRGFGIDRQMNLFRGVLAGLHLWFALQGRWAPPFKWWTREVNRLEMRPDTRGILESAILNPSIETLIPVRDHLKSEMRAAGIAEVDDLAGAFLERLRPERREDQYRHTYL
jgi:hypothetical protein